MYQSPPKLPNNRFAVSFDGFRKLRFSERIKILFGYNLASHVKVLVDRKSQQVRGGCSVSLTKHVNEAEFIKSQIVEPAEPK